MPQQRVWRPVEEKKTEKRWVAKYALTKGIYAILATTKDGYAREQGRSYGTYSGKMGRDDFVTPEDALARGEELRARKIKSLEKQLEKLRKLKIEVIR